jgi:hypothetical protein
MAYLSTKTAFLKTLFCTSKFDKKPLFLYNCISYLHFYTYYDVLLLYLILIFIFERSLEVCS